MSFNFSVSNEESKVRVQNVNILEAPKLMAEPYQNCQSSIYHISQQISPRASIKENINKVEGLEFRGYPKRKMGKCVMKQEKYFSYEQSGPENVKKMRDSFGQAYQEYFLSESSSCKSKESYFCVYQSRNIEQSG